MSCWRRDRADHVSGHPVSEDHKVIAGSTSPHYRDKETYRGVQPVLIELSKSGSIDLLIGPPRQRFCRMRPRALSHGDAYHPPVFLTKQSPVCRVVLGRATSIDKTVDQPRQSQRRKDLDQEETLRRVARNRRVLARA